MRRPLSSRPRNRDAGGSARRPLALVLALLGCLLARAATSEDAPDLDWIDRDALAAGEVLVRSDRAERPLTASITVATEIDAPPAVIWDVLIACQLAPQYVPNVVSCRSIEKVDDGRGELFLQVVKPAFFLPTFEHVFRLDYHPYRRIDVHRVSGPLAHLEGSWWLLPQPSGKILLIYGMEIDPGGLVPRFLVRATLKRDLPRLVRAVRERAEAAAR
ncbi:MAG TPA: SRPBCC family protein [Gammaproteobacteria bacterium]|nr:SRPBCC family protein [Gammaproteobacteria bacterium]